jgi:glycosyltransferase involved in cell wall biosynthesis
MGYGAVVKSHIMRAKIQQDTTVLGMVSGNAKLALLCDADAWALPSYTENFGLAAVEALASGAPVIVSDRVDIHEEVARAAAGLVVRCEVGDLAAAILRLLSDENLRRRVSNAGRQLARTHFTWDASSRKLVEAYEAIVAAGRRRSSEVAIAPTIN